MSQTFSLICRETKRRVWIGQGWGKMESLYSGDAAAMARLKLFLNEHIGKPLEFVCDDRNDEVFEFDDGEVE